MTADVHRRRRPIVINHVRLAPEEMIDHAINGFLIARDDARGEHHSVAFFNFGVLVIVDRRAGQCRHRLTLGSADQHADLFGGEILHLAGMDQQPLGNLDVAQIFSDLGRAVHRTSTKGNFAPMLPGQFHRQLDAMNRG